MILTVALAVLCATDSRFNDLGPVYPPPGKVPVKVIWLLSYWQDTVAVSLCGCGPITITRGRRILYIFTVERLKVRPTPHAYYARSFIQTEIKIELGNN
ncbi:hypothetical protein NQ317_016276 [Molorchus minor]|uniref:Secreted protein n=1 Tax=Molorchus minor TaxID=1323400 RepID=A0ABQ9JZ37_9CUCU|nr:hypothetical protein NQ317_016276 [Molorchus minor]